MRVAIVHYWLLNYRGGERVIKALLEIYPNADIYTLFSDKKIIEQHFKQNKVFNSFLNKIPFKKKIYRFLLPFMPLALESFNLEEYDLIISSESGPAKGVITPPNSIHICYCHSPMRYIWDMKDTYLKQMGVFSSLFLKLISHYMRIWDTSSSTRVDYFISNSSFIQKRIKKFYRRDSAVIHPPTDTSSFHHKKSQGYFLIISELVSYKRIDLAIDVFNELKQPLIVIGSGPEKKKLQKKIDNDNIQLLGKLSQKEIIQYYSACEAFIVCAKEDFGITTVESLASGKPVIAYKEGGSLDILNEKNSIFFKEQTISSLKKAIEEYNKKTFHYEDCQKQASLFSKSHFQQKIIKYIENLYYN